MFTAARAPAPSTAAKLRHIPHAALAVSEPSPFMFGNGENVPRSQNPAWTNKNWLKSRFHFAFAEYSNRDNTNFGVLRVLNDDLVQPDRGFGTHPHADMEIATYIVKGALTHQDSMGSMETLERGGVQFMSAGTGVRHSEFNKRKDSDLRFIQMWLVPRQRGLKPRYGQYQGKPEERRNAFFHLVADDRNANAAAPVKVACDANIYVAELEAGRTASVALSTGRQAYAVILEGTKVGVRLNAAAANAGRKPQEEDCEAPTSNTCGDDAGTAQAPVATSVGEQHDAYEVYAGPAGASLTFSAPPGGAAHVLVVEMADDGRGGRRDLA